MYVGSKMQLDVLDRFRSLSFLVHLGEVGVQVVVVGVVVVQVVVVEVVGVQLLVVITVLIGEIMMEARELLMTKFVARLWVAEKY